MRSCRILRAVCSPAIRTSIFPGRYIQGPGALGLLGTELARFSETALLLVDPLVHKSLLPEIKKTVDGKIKHTIEVFNGECCDDEINRLSANQVGAVAGVGGGKTLDTCKAVAHSLNVPMAIVPTLASSDAPCSALSVIYTKSGEFDRYLILPHNPNLVLVDSSVICRAPVRFFVSGMGDALSTWFEAESCFNTRSANMTGFVGSFTSLELARLCYNVLLKYGLLAKRACEAKTPVPALERVIEANTLLSGLGFESNGLGAAHAIHNGLVMIPQTHKFWHGEKVTIGVLSSLFLTDRPAEVINTVYDFCESVGLPTTLADIGITKEHATEDTLMKVAIGATAKGETIHNEAGIMTPEAVISALRMADEYGRSRKVH